MNTIKQFLEKHTLQDANLTNYREDIIEKILDILNGQIKEEYEDTILLNYIGLYYANQINDDTIYETASTVADLINKNSDNNGPQLGSQINIKLK